MNHQTQREEGIVYLDIDLRIQAAKDNHHNPCVYTPSWLHEYYKQG